MTGRRRQVRTGIWTAGPFAPRVRAMTCRLVLCGALGFAALPCTNAATEDEVRAAFDRFVEAQNAHDLASLTTLLLDSPSFLWVTRGTPIWGRDAALKKFGQLYEGTWHLEPQAGEFRVVLERSGVAQIFVPIVFSIGAPGQPPQTSLFLMNQVLVRSGKAWKVASILPVPSPAPPR